MKLTTLQKRILIAISNKPNSDERDIREILNRKSSIQTPINTLLRKRLLKSKKLLDSTFYSLNERGEKEVKEISLLIEKEGYSRKAFMTRGFTAKATEREAHKKTVRSGETITIPKTKVKSKKVPSKRIPKTEVKPSEYRILDRGKPGRGKQVIPTKKLKRDGRIVKELAIRNKMISKDKTLGDITQANMKELALLTVKEFQKQSKAKTPGKRKIIAVRRAKGFFQALENLNVRTNPELSKKASIARKEISKTYPKELTPTEAIKKWKSMPPEERERKAPERKGNPEYKKVQKKVKQKLRSGEVREIEKTVYTKK